MKVIKLTKKMLKMHPADLLVELGAVDIPSNQGYPQHVFFAKEDYRELRKNLKQYAKKQAPNATERLINYSVGADLLNYGPSELLADAIRPGYALVDEEKINVEIVTAKLTG